MSGKTSAQTKQDAPLERVKQVEASARVGSVALDPREHRACFRRKWRKRRIVFDLIERALTLRRHLDAGIEDPQRIEAALHQREARSRLLRPHALEERRAESAIAVLARQRST